MVAAPSMTGRTANMRIVALVLGLLIHRASQTAVAEGSGSSCNIDAATWPGPPPFRECRLQYYVQVFVGDPSLNQNLLPPLNESFSGSFGHGELFAFNATEGPEQTSSRVGSVRGFTIDSAYKASDIIDLIEVELISYDDGNYKGTIQIQGEIRAISPNEVAIVGGTGSFRGARGFGLIERVLLDGPYRRFHHDLHFVY
ncbi:hypothetical protein KP509_03G052200 [Ceratopteris richardii]|uniref:Dirigent protein n=1 Tax=Ceratopteris richardii TaxID=49495 RepID=A0A8T2V7P3_CERRI|nr:hypothetical protein KP509_03G052100 [Ceratopteris richardii]KAH7441745.1 hypothetical protein KP509_03G052200 [Ceratopteris richardii]